MPRELLTLVCQECGITFHKPHKRITCSKACLRKRFARHRHNEADERHELKRTYEHKGLTVSEYHYYKCEFYTLTVNGNCLGSYVPKTQSLHLCGKLYNGVESLEHAITIVLK